MNEQTAAAVNRPAAGAGTELLDFINAYFLYINCVWLIMTNLAFSFHRLLVCAS